MTHQTYLAQFIRRFETLTPESVDQLAALYSNDAYFKDPFNEVRGHSAITGIFGHMFKQVDKPRFVVKNRIVRDDQAFIVWDFTFQTKGSRTAGQCIHGSSYLCFDPDGRVNYHRDYWDAAEELYEKVPLLGSLMRFLKRRVMI